MKANHSLTRIRVLIADDHLQMRQTLLRLLQRDGGLEIVGAVACAQATEEARRLTPDVIVLDIRVPRMDSLGVAQQILADGSDARVLFMSMSDEPLLIERIQAAGGLGFVHKEFLIDRLQPAIRAVFAGHPYFGSWP